MKKWEVKAVQLPQGEDLIKCLNELGMLGWEPWSIMAEGLVLVKREKSALELKNPIIRGPLT